jgi:hypothetical protein
MPFIDDYEHRRKNLLKEFQLMEARYCALEIQN